MALGRNEAMKKDQCLVKLKQRTAKSGDVYAFYVEMLGKYGACQILAVDGKSICYVLLDYLENDLPGEDVRAQKQSDVGFLLLEVAHRGRLLL